jgi:hypothetical protein
MDCKSWVPVVHTCNPSYVRGRDQEERENLQAPIWDQVPYEVDREEVESPSLEEPQSTSMDEEGLRRKTTTYKEGAAKRADSCSLGFAKAATKSLGH